MSSAIISPCGAYRYLLTRSVRNGWPKLPPLVFVMLNPSTADASIDDPTVRRLRGFAERWRCDGLVVANAYAYRTSSPADLWHVSDPIGPANDEYLRILALEHEIIFFGWGNNIETDREQEIEDIFKHNLTLCLGHTNGRNPRHPLYVRSDEQPRLFRS